MKIYVKSSRDLSELDSIIGKDIWVYGQARDFGTKWFRILYKSSNLFIVNVLPVSYTKLDSSYPNFKERNWSMTPNQFDRVMNKTEAVNEDDLIIDDLVRPRTSEELFNVEGE